MIKIILDTNFLLIPGYFGVDIFELLKETINDSYEVCILEGSLDELDNIIKRQHGKHEKAAKLALQLLKDKKIKIIKKQKNLYMNFDSENITIDDILVKISDKDTIVATQDKQLKKKLWEKGIKTITLRSKKHLELR